MVRLEVEEPAIGCLGLVANRMRQRDLKHLIRIGGRLGGPIAETGSHAVHGGSCAQLAQDGEHAIAPESVAYMHLAGHENNQTYIIDTHDHPVVDGVWDLYAHAVRRIGPSQSLRTLDALQLAVALDLNDPAWPVTFVCADVALGTIAAAEGLTVINPEVP